MYLHLIEKSGYTPGGLERIRLKMNMYIPNSYKRFLLIVSVLCVKQLMAQTVQTSDSQHIIIAAGPQYKKPALYQFLWGKHYRTEWTTPVRIKKIDLDTAFGKLTPYASGGSRQTKSLRLRDENKHEYVLRSIDKTFGKALPDIFRHTFVEKLIDDQVSIAHPFAAVMVAPLAEAAHIYHTWPQNVYVQPQKSLDTFNAEYANTLYLLEQRPDENWETAGNFGNAKKIISTEKLFEQIFDDNTHRVNQEAYIRARLFDMFVGDWGRHEDQWRWAKFEHANQVIYKPIPRDRDQTFTKFDGTLLTIVRSAAGLSHQQTFGPTITNISTYNFAARYLDRLLANEMQIQYWINTAKELQALLTDSVITFSVRRMPPELFSFSGNKIISDLKSRRDHLQQYAIDYYNFLSKDVDIVGTKGNEYFEIGDAGNGAVQVSMYANKKQEGVPPLLYQRTFYEDETHEIRIYGLNGEDIYKGDISQNKKITVRIIGGPANDKYDLNANSTLHIYDGKEQLIKNSGSSRLHLVSDSAVHSYRYDAFKYDKSGFSPSVYIGTEDTLYAGVGYTVRRHKWRREPFANRHSAYIHYSFPRNAITAGYEGIVNNISRGWDVVMDANYDLVRWTNFFGLGNETIKATDSREFYRLRSENVNLRIGVSHALGAQSRIYFFPYFQTVRLLNDTDRYLTKDYLHGEKGAYFNTKQFAGAGLQLRLQNVNDGLLPSKGIRFTGSAVYANNIQTSADFANFAGEVQLFVPLLKNIVLAVKNGAAHVSGEPEFYQLNDIGGRSLRGFRRERYWGQTAYHNNNDLIYLFDVKSFVYKGKAGIAAFVDQGRVWLEGEKSTAWHRGYGGGLILCPFNKVYISLMYGRSRDSNGILHFDFRRSLK
jgi:hypothetical protein